MVVKGIEYVVNGKGKKTGVIIPYTDFVKIKGALEKTGEKEYMIMAEESMKEIWDNEEDEKEWSRYL